MDQNQIQNQNFQTLEDIQRKIAETLGVTDSTDQKDLDMMDKATDVILKKIFLDTIEKLSDEDADAYAMLLEEERSPEDIQKFLNEKISDFNALRNKTIEDFLREMKEAMQAKPQ